MPSILISMVCRAQESVSLDSQVTTVLGRMANSDMATRHAGFDDFIKMISDGKKLGFDPEYPNILATFLARHPDQADRVTLGLVNLLQADDNAFTDRKIAPGTYRENDSEHWAAVLDLVSCLNDERTIPALVGAMTAGGGSCKGLLQYGQKPLGPVLSKLNDPDPLVRSRALGVGITILRMKNDAASQAQILSLIRTAVHDSEYALRSAALYQIDNLHDQKQFVPALREFVPALQDMAQRDPFSIPRENRYPLRDRAKKLLEEIATH
jgi:hypothetical protein